MADSGTGGGRWVDNSIQHSRITNSVQAGYIETINLHQVEPKPYRAPRQLPAPHRVAFVNRTCELAALNRALAELGSGHGPAVLVFTGLAGVGKTELIAHWAAGERRRDTFPDGELYADLDHGRLGGQADLGAVLGRFLTALGEEQLPGSTEDRAALYRTLTSGRRLLVCLDGVEQAAEVRTLLPSDGLVVVTARRLRNLGMVGGPVERVQPLTDAAGCELVRSWLGAGRGTDPELTELARRCGGIPQAINVLGSRLLLRQRLPIGRVLAELARQASKEEHPMAEATMDGGAVSGALDALDAACTGLSDPARQLYRFLGVHPGTGFSPELARAAGCASVDAALLELLEAHLIDETAPDAERADHADHEERYTRSGLVELHARRLAARELSGAEREQQLRAIVDYYLRRCAEADRAILGDRFRLQPPPVDAPGPDSGAGADGAAGRKEQLDWLEAQSSDLLAVLRAAAAAGWHTAVWQLCESLWPLYHGRKLHADWVDAHELAIDSAQLDARPDAEIRMRNQLARAYEELADLDAADRQLTAAAGLLELVAEPRLTGVIRESQGLLCLRRGRAAEAIALFTEARDANAGDPHGLLVQSYNLAQALLAADQGAEALGEVERAGQAARQTARQTGTRRW